MDAPVGLRNINLTIHSSTIKSNQFPHFAMNTDQTERNTDLTIHSIASRYNYFFMYHE